MIRKHIQPIIGARPEKATVAQHVRVKLRIKHKIYEKPHTESVHAHQNSLTANTYSPRAIMKLSRLLVNPSKCIVSYNDIVSYNEIVSYLQCIVTYNEIVTYNL